MAKKLNSHCVCPRIPPAFAPVLADSPWAWLGQGNLYLLNLPLSSYLPWWPLWVTAVTLVRNISIQVTYLLYKVFHRYTENKTPQSM